MRSDDVRSSPAAERDSSHALRVALLAQLENLHDPALLEKVMMLIGMPRGVRPSSANPPVQRALAMVEWSDSPLGTGLARLQESLGKLAVPPPREPDASDADDHEAVICDALCEAESRLKELIQTNSPPEAIELQKEQIAKLRRARYEGLAPQPGCVLAGRYELLEPLGAGGFGAVWKAYDHERLACVAIKILHARFRSDESMQRRFRLGARAMEELAREHKHIVQVLAPAQRDNGYCFYAMEHLAKGNLEAAVLGQRFTNDELYPAISQAGSALHFAHTRGVIHRDVNPSNILMHDDGSFRLSDFDLARVPHASIGSAAQIGRPEYMAPEVLYGGAKGDARSDLYSLAKSVQFLIWGQELPLEGKKDAAGFSVSLPCPAAVQQVLQKALADNPSERHASVADFLNELETALAAEEPGATPSSAASAPRSNQEKKAPAAPVPPPPPPPSPTGPTAAALQIGISRRLVQWPNEERIEQADYEIVGQLALGGMGAIYRARQTQLNREVALKVLRLESRRTGRQQQSGQQRFLAEARIAGALDHPHIAPIYDLAVDQQGRLFYTMKIVRGQTWSGTLRETAERENLEILLRICDAVAYAHSQGVVHRDLKPGNVMVGDYGELYVMDWGLAAASEEFQDMTGTMISESIGGTPSYMAPEMISGEAGGIGPATDVYLLGALLYEILTGNPPHAGATPMEILASVSRNVIAPTARNDRLVNVALQAMSTRPDERYASVREFQKALRTSISRHDSRGPA
jgi:serine/threonine protein kinase